MRRLSCSVALAAALLPAGAFFHADTADFNSLVFTLHLHRFYAFMSPICYNYVCFTKNNYHEKTIIKFKQS
jgi:hypothetical protein